MQLIQKMENPMNCCRPPPVWRDPCFRSPLGERRGVWAMVWLSSCLTARFSERRSWQRDVPAVMALQMRSGDAFYQCAEYCRNYTSPPVSYSDSSHYLARLPGKKKAGAPQKSHAQLRKDWLESNRRWLGMVKARGCCRPVLLWGSAATVLFSSLIAALQKKICDCRYFLQKMQLSSSRGYFRSEVWNKKQCLDCIHLKWRSQRRWENQFLCCVICTDDMWQLIKHVFSMHLRSCCQNAFFVGFYRDSSQMCQASRFWSWCTTNDYSTYKWSWR